MAELDRTNLTNIEARSAILIVDDDEQVRGLLYDVLRPDHDCTRVASAEEALNVLENGTFDLVISDINMSGVSGLELVPLIHQQAPDTVVIMISGQQTIDFAIEALRAGAFDYVTKPFDLRQVHAAVQRALKHHRLLQEKRRYENHLEELVQERTAEIEHLAYHDQLTNLPNRALFLTKCEEALSGCRANNQTGALLRVSIDRFKRIDDTLGHAAGDMLLTHVAERLQKCVQSQETLAKFDGDEFALMLTNVDMHSAARHAVEVEKAIDPVVHLNDGQEVLLTTSIGIALFPINGDDAATVLRNAGAALDRAKQQGGNSHEIYVPEMNAHAITRLGLEMNLRRAVEAKEFVTHYQPIVSLTSGRLVGFEALVRWNHPRLGLLPPGDFIGLAEDTGLILDVGGLVMSTACTQTRRWHQQGHGPIRIAINVSARQFRDEDFAARLLKVLSETRLDPQMLELEITETTVMEDFDSAIRLLSELRQIGIRVSIDDFGTGYSSLSYLKHLPIDTLKLDRSFVSGATSEPRDAALVMAIINLAHSLDLRVIAEGIETESQRDFLRLLRCNEGQGYFFAKPAPADAIDWTRLEPRRKPHIPANARPQTPKLPVNDNLQVSKTL
jgi:diguanylate cyclase (GGDEF)-like protein